MTIRQEAGGGFKVERRPWIQRLLRRAFFDYRSVPPLEDFPGAVTTEVHVLFHWRDRLRLLVRPRLVVTVRAYTEQPTGRALRTDAVVFVPPPGSEKP